MIPGAHARAMQRRIEEAKDNLAFAEEAIELDLAVEAAGKALQLAEDASPGPADEGKGTTT